ncbi:MAG: helix-turn-helix domain-containing protein [Sphingomonas oligoaromativorans]
MTAEILHFARMSDYPNRIRELRLTRGWSQDQLAERVGCSKMQISGLERGKPILDTIWMRRLADALGVYPADLLSVEDNPMRVSDVERRYLQRYRNASPEEKATLERVTDAVTLPHQRDVA